MAQRYTTTSKYRACRDHVINVFRIILTVTTAISTGFVLPVSCRHTVPAGNRTRFEQLRTEASTQASRRNFSLSDSIGRILYSEAEKGDDDVYMAYGLLSQGYYDYGNGEKTEKRRSLAERALAKALETGNDTLISRAYNILGAYATLHTYDFAAAIHYFTEAKRYADAAGARDFSMAAECNISEIYHSIGDTLGITYDLDIYDFARHTDNPGLMHSAAQHVAEHYLRSPSTAVQALEYISSIDTSYNKYIHDRLMGDYWQTIGNYREAEQCYRQAITVETGSPGVYLSYGRLLNAQKKYAESLEMLRKAETRLTDKSIYNTYKMQLLQLRADNYRNIGLHKEALENMTGYIAVRDSIQEFRNKEQVNKFRIRYELGKKELEITRSHASIRIRNIIVITVSLVAVIIIISLIFYYRRRDRMLSVIIERQRELNQLRNATQSVLSTETHESDVLAVTVTETPEISDLSDPQDEAGQGGISEAKKNEIWSRIQHEINANKIYRDPAVSRDMFAERVGCNHTWFSQVIKERTGLSYPQYMNSQRIEEALVILSDPSSSMTHEELWRSLGFLSKATFYSSFKARMSMSPAEYRKRALTEM